MQTSIIVLNILYAIIGVALMWGAYRLFDRLSPDIDFQVELQKGNLAVSVFIGSLFLAIAVIIAGALG